jgi:hypothetical protein
VLPITADKDGIGWDGGRNLKKVEGFYRNSYFRSLGSSPSDFVGIAAEFRLQHSGTAKVGGESRTNAA